MGRTARGSRLPALLLLLLLVAAGGAAAWNVPPGTSPALDRARAEAGKAYGKARDRLSPPPAPGPPAGGALRTVVRTVDGDTVVLDGNEKVRLIGVNAPESVDPRRPVQWYGKEAAAHTRGMLQGKRVRLEHDVERKDRYGRTLAYLWLEDGTFVNLRLVAEGYATAYRYPPNVRHAERFRDAERLAREAGRGLWSDGKKAKGLKPSSLR